MCPRTSCANDCQRTCWKVWQEGIRLLWWRPSTKSSQCSRLHLSCRFTSLLYINLCMHLILCFSLTVWIKSSFKIYITGRLRKLVQAMKRQKRMQKEMSWTATSMAKIVTKLDMSCVLIFNFYIFTKSMSSLDFQLSTMAPWSIVQWAMIILL